MGRRNDSKKPASGKSGKRKRARFADDDSSNSVSKSRSRRPKKSTVVAEKGGATDAADGSGSGRADPGSETNLTLSTSSTEDVEPGRIAPQVVLSTTGDLALDQDSLIKAPRIGQNAGADAPRNVVHESGSRPRSGMAVRKSVQSVPWSNNEVELFYKGLRQFGTEFTMIAMLFPNRTRRQVKDKFKKEERVDPKRVESALKAKEPIDVEEFRRLATEAKRKRDEVKKEKQQTAAAEAAAAGDGAPVKGKKKKSAKGKNAK